jgi:hypothetical protein
MEKHFLNDFVEGEPGFRAEPWYNADGDCIVFKAQDVGVVAERVDDILTLYLSAEDEQPVGFQIKGVKHLMERFRCNAVSVSGETQGNRVRVSLAFLLLTAYDELPKTIRRRNAYALAQRSWCRSEPAISLDVERRL